MKLRTIEIDNFRGIGHAKINFSNFTTLIGPNNIGKSTILEAVNLVLDNKKPKMEDWPGQKPSDLEMNITCVFQELTEWERKKPAISGLILNDQLIIRIHCKWKETQEDYTWEYSVYNEEERIELLEGNWTEIKARDPIKGICSTLGIKSKADFEQRKNEVIQELLKTNPDAISKSVDWHEKKFANSLQQAIPKILYVPATFKIEDELKTTQTSPFAYLFSNKLFPAVKKDGTFFEFSEKTALLQKKIQGKSDDGKTIEGLDKALGELSSTLNRIMDFNSSVKVKFDEIDIEPLFMKAAKVLISEEIDTSLQYQGSGVQRALAYALLESNAEISEESSDEKRSVIVLFEEPELYIHPHLMRRMKNTLRERSLLPNWQVICSTHSPFLIDIGNEPESLKLVRRGENNTRSVHQIDSSLFQKNGDYDERAFLRASLDFHPTVSECFFAKRALLVEGDTEVAVFTMAKELCKSFGIEKHLCEDTTVISAGGKWPIISIAKVLKQLNIDFLVLHDQDRKGRSEKELKALPGFHPYNANKRIESIAGSKNVYVVDDTFEHVIWDKVNADDIKDTEKPYNAWVRIRDFLNDPKTLTDEQKDRLKEIVKFSFGV